MDDANQIEVPPSFLALFTDASGTRLTQSPARVRERYSLCEDMAIMLAERAAASYHSPDASKAAVLDQLRAIVTSGGTTLQAPEAEWVVSRTAELLEG